MLILISIPVSIPFILYYLKRFDAKETKILKSKLNTHEKTKQRAGRKA